MDEIGRIRDALACIPADLRRDEWARIGAALKNEMGDAGFDLFDDWSKSADNYDAAAARSTWRSLSADAGIKIGTLFYVAREHGFDLKANKATPVDPAELDRRRVEREKRAEQEARAGEMCAISAAGLAETVWRAAKPTEADHPYLMRKGIQPVDALREIEAGRLAALIGYQQKQGDDLLTGRVLVAPVKVGGKLSTVEMIDGDGRKSALKDGVKAGGYWLTRPIPDDATLIHVCEGVATALSVHECTGAPAVAALSCGNLRKVAEALKAKHPNARIVVCGDIGNGEHKAREAAVATGAALALPDFGPKRRDDQTDFNDLHQDGGAAAVMRAIDQATPIERPQSTNDGCVPAGFSVTERGVFYEEDDGTPHWICSPLHVRALVRDRASENWGRLLEWNDADGHPHVWAMPMEMLRSDGADMRGELARLGLDIAPGNKARNKLTEYVTCAKPKARGRCVTRTGWHGGAFVFPDRTIGEARERVIFQAESIMRTYSQSGTLDEWKSGVARFCVGNSRLLLAVSAAFASMMLEYSGQESGGLNLVGESSSGKTTALRAACSVFGGKEYMQRWRATANGLEGLASLHNDTLLVLDELAQVDAREAGEIAYMLANGSGKARAGRSGTARARQTWKLLFLSAGEIGLSQHLQSVGKKTKAGQEVRLVEIPADAGAGFGLFEELHGMTGGAELSTAINDAAIRCYGTAAVAFLEALCKDRDEIGGWLTEEIRRFVDGNLPADSSGQAHRVCQRFALIGLAGECATAAGITEWNEGDALGAAATCFSVWLDGRGGAGNQEKDTILSHVKAFFEAHEESRFSDLNDTSDRPTINRAGFRRTGETGVEYLVLPEVFKREICTGLDPKAVARALIEAGWVRPAANGWAQRAERLPGKGPTKVYVFTAKIWEASR
ncbi:hypothetical protein PI86_11020 [Burkholderia sp. A9]|nr:hypothetical protein PI86_11020 [Burkholderia sp. A9]